jgi:hypothetical protein
MHVFAFCNNRIGERDPEAGRAHVRVVAALGDETRLALVARLCVRSPQSIS